MILFEMSNHHDHDIKLSSTFMEKMSDYEIIPRLRIL